jgi:hypothetical protein
MQHYSKGGVGSKVANCSRQLSSQLPRNMLQQAASSYLKLQQAASSYLETSSQTNTVTWVLHLTSPTPQAHSPCTSTRTCLMHILLPHQLDPMPYSQAGATCTFSCRTSLILSPTSCVLHSIAIDTLAYTNDVDSICCNSNDTC